MDDRRSPRIAAISWGHMEVDGVGTVKDSKLRPGGTASPQRGVTAITGIGRLVIFW